MRVRSTCVALAVAALTGSASASAGASGLFGKVERGPTLPVCLEAVPCTEAAANVTLFFVRRGAPVVRARTDRAGRYSVRLRPGRYLVRTSAKPPGAVPEPSRVDVPAGRVRHVDFLIDTGIR